MKYDPMSYNLGVILVRIGAATEEQILEALEIQHNATTRDLLGKILLALDAVSQEQLEKALKIQNGLRSARAHVRAVAAVDLAKESSTSIMSLVESVKESTETIKKGTSGGGFPAVTAEIEK